ncbi:MAG: RecX family transcriptional regulator [Anaerolineaceae bacterium]|jgi:regulatory protein
MERKITGLKAQKRNPNRVSVYLDGEYAFGLARIVAAWLHVGQALDEHQIARLKNQDTAEVAFQTALKHLSYRPRSEAEVRQKLSSSGYAETVIEAVITRLQDSKLIHDAQFAQLWVENRSAFRPRSQKLLKMELKQKGIHDDTIETALADANNDGELAYQAAVRRVSRYAGLDWQQFRQKLGGFLARRGFSYGTIAPIVRSLWAEVQSGKHTNTLMENERINDES